MNADVPASSSGTAAFITFMRVCVCVFDRSKDGMECIELPDEALANPRA